ncbi:MAG: amidohydrolase family protein [Kiritimatiellia bacterium]
MTPLSRSLTEAREITDCMVWLGPDLTPTRCRRFSWEQDRITGIFPAPDEASPVRYGILPGLINGHTHVGDCFIPEVAVPLTLEEAFFRPEGYKYRALREIEAGEHITRMEEFQKKMAASGTVLHVDFREQGAEGARRLREASRRSGVQSVILSQFNDSPQTGDELNDPSRPLPESALEELRGMLGDSDGFSESTMNDLTDAAWVQIRDTLRPLRKCSAIHCLENPSYRDLSLSRTGRGDLRRALDLLDPDLVVHLTVASAEEIDLLAASGKTAVLNPRANAALGLPLPPIAALMQAGVNLLLGTDNGILNGPNLFSELDFAYRLARSQWGDGRRPLPVDILKMVTANFARTPWGTDSPGTLTPGGPASFVVINLQAPPFCHSRELTGTVITRTSPGDILLTLHQGKILHAR